MRERWSVTYLYGDYIETDRSFNLVSIAFRTVVVARSLGVCVNIAI